MLEFSRIDHGDVQVHFTGVSLKYGPNTLNLLQGESGTISLPEVSDLIDGQGRVPVTMEYTLINNTSKAFRFRVFVSYGDGILKTTQVTLAGNASKKIVQRVKLQPTNSNKNLIIHGPVGISDDTHIIFFNAELWTRINPV